MVKRTLLLFALLALVSCNQVADRGKGATSLGPAFGTLENDYVGGLAPSTSGVYIAGNTFGDLHEKSTSIYNDSDGYIRKYDRNGKLLWGTQFGTNSNDFVTEVAVDKADNTYVVGDTTDLANSRLEDAFIRKYNPSGNVLWSRQFGTAELDYATHVMASNSGVYVVGYTFGSLDGPSNGLYDAFIRKYNPNGTVAWTDQFGTSQQDMAYAVAVDNRGYAYVVGQWEDYEYYGNEPQIAYNGKMFIRQYSPSGRVPWAKTTDHPDYEEEFASAVAVSGSSVYVGGISLSKQETTSQIYAQHIFKYDTTGKKLWAKMFKRTSPSIVDLSADSSGVVFGGINGNNFAGPNQGKNDGYVYKMDPSGNKLWSKAIGTAEDDSTEAVVIGFKGEIYAAGMSDKDPTKDGFNYNAFLRQFNGADGTVVWTK